MKTDVVKQGPAHGTPFYPYISLAIRSNNMEVVLMVRIYFVWFLTLMSLLFMAKIKSQKF